MKKNNLKKTSKQAVLLDGISVLVWLIDIETTSSREICDEQAWAEHSSNFAGAMGV